MTSHAYSLADYWRCMRDHGCFRLLLIGGAVDLSGSWLAQVAIYLLLESKAGVRRHELAPTTQAAPRLCKPACAAPRPAGGAGLAVAAVNFTRVLPALLLAPAAGVVADRCNRVRVLVAAALVGAGAAAAMPLVTLLPPGGAALVLLYSLLLLQFAGLAFQQPARAATVPATVPRAALQLASTLDSTAWSLTAAVGASLGGFLAARLGAVACFWLDAGTYLAAAACMAALPPSVGVPGAGAAAACEAPTGTSDDEAGGTGEAGDTNGSYVGPLTTGLQDGQAQPACTDGISRDGKLEERSSSEDAEMAARAAAAAAAPVPGQLEPSAAGAAAPWQHAASGLRRSVARAAREGWAAYREGWRFLHGPGGALVGACTTIKAFDTTLWAPTDVLIVKYAQLPAMQRRLGSEATVLGAVYASVGVGSLLGPLLLNALVPPRPPRLLGGVAGAFLLVAAGHGLMALSGSLAQLLLANLLRSAGSGCVWVWSTLLLQLLVPDTFLGRVTAVEAALFNASNLLCSFGGGAAFDLLHRGVVWVATVLSGMAAAWAVLWVAVAVGGGMRRAHNVAGMPDLPAGHEPLLQE